MNSMVFDRNINVFNQAIDSIHDKLKTNSNIPSLVIGRFDEALNQLELLNCNFTAVDSSSVWHIANRIVQFDNLRKRVKGIQARILKVDPHCYLVNKIKYKTMPTLVEKVRKLIEMIGSKGRLPFSGGVERELVHLQCKKELQLQDKEKTISAEREFFHLLGNYFEQSKISAINIGFYEMHKEIYSLESWIQVLNLWIKEGSSADKKVGTSLLSIIQKTLPPTLKINFAYNVRKSYRKNLAYFKDLVRSQATPQSPFTPSAFLEKYKADRVPQSVLINEAAWDRVASIHQMRAGDCQLFTFGTFYHCVAVEVSCIKPAVSSDKGNYQYKIFNTEIGVGIEKYHELDDAQAHTRPLIFNNLPREAFSYSFFAKLIDIDINKVKMEDFYQLHDRVLVEEFGGKKDVESGALYSIQRYGTCTYASVEAWIKSFLTEEQSRHLDIVKVQMAVRKQRKVVKMHQKKLRGFIVDGQLVDGKGKRLTDSICTTRVNALKENRILLALGEECMTNMRREQSGRNSKSAETRK